MRKINSQNWYQFRKRASKVHPFILDLMYHYSTTSLMTKVYGALPIEIIEILEGDWCNANVSLRNLNNFGHSIIKKIYGNPKFTSYLLYKSKKNAQRMVRNLKELKQNEVIKFSDKKIYKIYSQLVEDYRLFCFFSFPVWIFGERILFSEIEKILKKRKVADSEFNKFLTILVMPRAPSFVLQEEIEVLKLAQKLKDSTPLKKIKNRIKNLVNQFGFMVYDYRGPKTKKENDYLREIKKNSKKTNLKEEIEEKNDFYRKLGKQQEKLIKNFKLTPKEKGVISAIQDAAVLQDIRKYYNSYFNFKTEILIKEIARRIKIPFQLIRYILPDEMKKVWRYKMIDKKFLEEKTKLCVLNIKKGEVKIYSGKAMKPFLVLREEYYKKSNVIKGVVASTGKVSGRVRIIKNKEEVKKIKRGEILVTPMTMPDFAPALKKCIAIITDEGGITCHAAIVSRELGIPCIIGTKIATKVLKDGDLVEVDADKGIVKILKRRDLKSK